MKKRSILKLFISFLIFFIINILLYFSFPTFPLALLIIFLSGFFIQLYFVYWLYTLIKDLYNLNLSNKNIIFKPIIILLVLILFLISGFLLHFLIGTLLTVISFPYNPPEMVIIFSEMVMKNFSIFSSPLTKFLIMILPLYYIFFIYLFFKIGVQFSILTKKENIYSKAIFYSIIYIVFSLLLINFIGMIFLIQYEINNISSTNCLKEKTQQLIYDEFGNKIESSKTVKIIINKEENNNDNN